MCRLDIRRFCEEWRIWIRPLLIVTYAIFAIIVVPLLIVNSVKDGFQQNDQLILIGGLFVLSAVPISIWHIIQHVIHFTKPILQKHIIRILWMVPIYALNAVSGPMEAVEIETRNRIMSNYCSTLLALKSLKFEFEFEFVYSGSACSFPSIPSTLTRCESAMRHT